MTEDDTTDDRSADASESERTAFDKDAFLEQLREDEQFRSAVRDALGTDDGGSSPRVHGTDDGGSSRRSVLKGAGTALGLGGLLAAGAETAGAKPQGEIGTNTTPVSRLFVDRITLSGSGTGARRIESVAAIHAETVGDSNYQPVNRVVMGGAAPEIDMNAGDVVDGGTVEASTADLSGLSMAGNDVSNVGTIDAATVSASDGDFGHLSGTTMVGDVDAATNKVTGLGGLSMAGDIQMNDTSSTGFDIENAGTIDATGLSMHGDVEMSGHDVRNAGSIDAASVTTSKVTADVVSTGTGFSGGPAVRLGNSNTGLYVSPNGNLKYVSGGSTFASLVSL
ncbi:MAG: hypothetical protein ABEJ89_01235 [Haloarculaceae archaeon]